MNDENGDVRRGEMTSKTVSGKNNRGSALETRGASTFFPRFYLHSHDQSLHQWFVEADISGIRRVMESAVSMESIEFTLRGRTAV